VCLSLHERVIILALLPGQVHVPGVCSILLVTPIPLQLHVNRLIRCYIRLEGKWTVTGILVFKRIVQAWLVAAAKVRIAAGAVHLVEGDVILVEADGTQPVVADNVAVVCSPHVHCCCCCWCRTYCRFLDAGSWQIFFYKAVTFIWIYFQQYINLVNQ